MNVIVGEENLREVSDKYTVLPLDTFRIQGRDPVKAYCIIENIPINDMSRIDELRDLHEKLIENYAGRNWNFCEQAIEHLVGKWNGEVDSFYQDLFVRVTALKQSDPDETWSHIIDR